MPQRRSDSSIAQANGSEAPPREGHPDADRWTVGRLLTWTSDFLRDRGFESPRLDAEVLLAHVLEWARVQLYTHFEDEVDTLRRASFRELVKRRAAGTPVAYLVGRKEFYSLTLHVGPAVLIPRPDTETVVVEFLTRFKDRLGPRVLELGTGSGAIALACASRHGTAALIATDISPDALDVAQSNAVRLKLNERIDFRLGDLFEAVEDEEPFDAILSNPPYIPTGDMAHLHHGVRDYEPHLALDGGADGLGIVRRIVAGAGRRLQPGGVLLLEIGTAQEAPVRALIGDRDEFELAATVRDAAHHPRVIRATRRG